MRRPSETPPVDVVELRDDDAPDFLDAHRVVLLAFLTPDDAPLRARLTLLGARLSAPGFGIGVVDVSRHRLVADALGVKSAPAMMLFRDGEVVDRLLGAPPDAVIEDVVRARMRG